MEQKSKHQQQTFWQIKLPIIGGLLLVIGIIWALIYFNQTHPALIENFANFILIFSMFIFIVVGLVVVFFTTKLTEIIHGWNNDLPTYTQIAQEKIDQVQPVVGNALDKAADVVIKPRSTVSAAKTVLTKKKEQ